jgi:signal transduction histidine kinase
MSEKNWLQKAVESVKEAHRDNMEKFGGEVKAMAREAVKDVRGTIHEIAFGSAEHPGEPGAPLSLTQLESYEQKYENEKAKDKEKGMDMDL